MSSGVKTDKAKESDRFSLFVATPSHRGLFCEEYMHSLLGLQKYCLTNAIEFQTVTAKIGMIDRARNVMASVFLLQNTASHMLFIDDDMGFNVEELVKMFEWRDKDVVAAMYPKKKFSWQRVKQAVLSNPDIDPARLPSLAAAYDDIFVLLDQPSGMAVGDKPVPVGAIGTGLMLISRQCLLRLVEKGNLPVIEQDRLTGRKVYEFFKTTIVNGKQMGEDFYFCNIVRHHGGEVLGCPWIKVTHTGQYSFEGDLKGLAKYGLSA